MPPKDWRETCPFQSSGPGLALRQGLRPGRFARIKLELRAGSIFHCHKTTTTDDDDDEGETYAGPGSKLCAGALAYQDKLGVSSNYVRVAERLDAMTATREENRR